MAKLAGKGGSVTWAAGYAANVLSWTLDYVGDALDTTDFADGASSIRSFLAGLKSWSGSYEAIVDDTTKTIAPGAAKSAATFTLGGSRTLTGDIIATSVSYSTTVDGLVVVSVSFQGTGALAIN